MLTAENNAPPLRAATGRQRWIRRRSRGVPLRAAVRFAVDVFFHFRCRATRDKALWSETEHVWLGRQTYLHWAIWDDEMDIPWTVAAAAGAPRDVNMLREAVRSELTSYWTDRIASLPRRKRPHWLPLP